MISNLKQLVVLLVFLTTTPFVTSAQIITKKISFSAGKSATTIQGTIVGDQTIDYTIAANQGQLLKVSLKPITKNSYYNVLPPGSEGEAIFIGQTEGNDCNLTLTKSGVYKIRVYQMRSSARRGEKASYSLNLSITRKNSSNPTASGDAKVSGTNYNATGDLRAANGSKLTTANFGVIRSKNGNAEVHTQLKSTGSKRIFVFSQGEWSCKSAGCKMTFAKISSDEWEVIVNGSEKYYIPEAVIYGG